MEKKHNKGRKTTNGCKIKIIEETNNNGKQKSHKRRDKQ